MPMELIGEDFVGDEVDDLLLMAGDDDDDDDYDVGDFVGYEELIGAAPRSRRARAARIKALRKQRSRGLKAVQERGNAGRQLWLGAQETAAAAGTLILRATVQELCKVVRIILAAQDNAGAIKNLSLLFVNDIKVGTNSQFVGLNPISAAAFDPNSTTNFQGYALATLQPGTDFSLTIGNAAAGDTITMTAVARTLR